jgi:hypothetical protein
MPNRRHVLLLPLLAPACAPREAPPVAPPAPIGYRHLLPLPLNVAALEILEADPPPPPGDVGAALSPRPAEAVRIMARDRLSAVGTQGRAVFAVTRAGIARGPGEALTCLVGCRLDILSPPGARLGFIEAEAHAAATGAEAARPWAAERLLRTAMDQLNVEFEFQLRRNLRDWLVAVPPGTWGGVPAPPPGGVTREDLPRS